MLILYSIFTIYESENPSNRRLVAIGILTGVLISFKVIGLSLYAALILHLAWHLFKHEYKKKWVPLVLITIIPILTAMMIQRIVIGSPFSDNGSWYTAVFFIDGIWETITNNTVAYWLTAQQYFEQEVWNWANVFMIFSVGLFFLIGWIRKSSKAFGLCEIFFMIYIAVILIYPYNNTSHRFLAPIIPLILYYVVIGLQQLRSINTRSLITTAFLAMLWSSNFIQFKNLIQFNQFEVKGPETNEAKAAFKYINKELQGETIAFTKPFVVLYYSQCNAQFVDFDNSLSTLEDHMKLYGTRHLLLCNDSIQSEVYSKDILDEVAYSSQFSLEWKNETFSLWKFELD